MDTRSIGYVVVHLGGGRRRAEDNINPAVGLADLCTVGQQLDSQTPLATLHAASESDWQHAAGKLKAAIRIEQQAVEAPPVIIERFDGVSVS